MDDDDEYEVEYNSNEGINKQFKASDAVQEYIKNALEKGQQPLPILDRITDNGCLLLMGYKMNSGNAESFGDALRNLVPDTLKKLFLMDNLLQDKDVGNIFDSLGQNNKKGLQSFTLV